MRNERVKWDVAELRRLYQDEKLSCDKIAPLYGVHYQTVWKALQRYSIPRRTRSGAITGGLHPNWRGGVILKKSSNGHYILVKKPEHHRANQRGYVLEHILVWEEHYGRRVRKNEVIHHLNGIKSDNRVENLSLMRVTGHNRVIPLLKERIQELEKEVTELRQLQLEGAK